MVQGQREGDVKRLAFSAESGSLASFRPTELINSAVSVFLHMSLEKKSLGCASRWPRRGPAKQSTTINSYIIN